MKNLHPNFYNKEALSDYCLGFVTFTLLQITHWPVSLNPK